MRWMMGHWDEDVEMGKKELMMGQRGEKWENVIGFG